MARPYNTCDLLVDAPEMEPNPEPSCIGRHVVVVVVVMLFPPVQTKLKRPHLNETKEVRESFAEKQTRNFNSLAKRFYPVHEYFEKFFIHFHTCTYSAGLALDI